MTTETTIEKRVQCSACGQKARRVSLVTLWALLKDVQAGGLVGGEHSCCASDGNGDTGCQAIPGDTDWRFCDSQDCDVVYFAEEGDTTFLKSQLKVSVGVKEKTGERPLCYCSGHSVASIKDELRTKGRSDALEHVRRKMNDPGCRCETENPSGSCCLGSVAKIAKIGTLFSAIMASACCWLPFVLLAVGVSGAGIAATPEAGAGEDRCAPTTKGRFNMMTLNKIMLWAVTALAIAFLVFPNYVGALVGSGEDKRCVDRKKANVAEVSDATENSTTTTMLHDLNDIQQLRKAFNAANGRPRLILLLSPT